MKEVYLLTSEHLESNLWFRDDDDFRVAMNYVAIQAACCTEVCALAFILMSNHVHFILEGEIENIQQFIGHFKSRYSQYYHSKYGITAILRRNKIDIKLIPREGEAMERAISYVQMNCVAANICSHPSQYPWGTGNTFYVQAKSYSIRLGEMSIRSRERLLHSNCTALPEDWFVCDGGFIYPGSYIDIRRIEALFKTPRRMNYFYNSSSKARKRIETIEGNLPSFRDQTIINVIPDLCKSLFGKLSFTDLQEEERVDFVKQIRFRFSADANQIARVCGISYAMAAKLLDSV